MLEFLQTGKALSVLAAIAVIGMLSKLITRNLYRRLLKETENMAMTKNKNLKILKQKLENAYRLNQNIVNTQAYLDKQLYGFRFMHLSLNAWNNVSTQMVILSLLAGGLGSFMAYWYRLDSYYIVLYASVGALCGLFLTFVDSSFNIPMKQQRLSTVLLEYVDNSVFVRAARENAGRDSWGGAVRGFDSPAREDLGSRVFGTSRSAGNTAASEEGRLAGVGSFSGFGRTSGKEDLETAAGNVALQECQEDGGARDRIARENDIRDGLVREEEPRKLSPRAFRSRNAKAEDLLRTVRSLKDEDLEPEQDEETGRSERTLKNGAARKSGTGKSGVLAASGRNGSLAGDGKGLISGEEKAGDSQARRDIDYLKRSLDQIAASKERSKKDEDWAKNLDSEEIKVLGEIMRQYFAGN